jgi:hypothetical protein
MNKIWIQRTRTGRMVATIKGRRHPPGPGWVRVSIERGNPSINNLKVRPPTKGALAKRHSNGTWRKVNVDSRESQK